MVEDRFNAEISRIQAEQIGKRIDVQGDRKVAESKFKDEFLQKLGLTDSQEVLQFSKHAISRLRKRNIEIGKAELERINTAVEKAATKSAKDSLILIDDLALIVSIQNKTVITAMDRQGMQEQVITNIDSAVIG